MYNLIDFKGFKAARIDLLRPFTLLIGPNGSGKTNVIEAIELLSFVARGQPLYEIADVGRTCRPGSQTQTIRDCQSTKTHLENRE